MNTRPVGLCGVLRTIAFVRSRRGAEVVSLLARHALAEVDPQLPRTVAAYRAGFLPEERRLLEQRLTTGDLRGVAATSALELGIDVTPHWERTHEIPDLLTEIRDELRTLNELLRGPRDEPTPR